MKGQNCTRRSVMVGAVASATAFTLTRTKAHAAEPRVHEVIIQSFAFVPERLEVSVGDIVRWTNNDLAPHTATAVEFGWDTEIIDNGESAEVVATQGMELTYFCVFHPHMKASLVIVSRQE